MAEHPLIKEWRTFSPDRPPHLFPQDRSNLPEEDIILLNSFEDYINNPVFGDRSDTLLHTGLLPMPFAGSLSSASIFILMINPGLGHLDYYEQQISYLCEQVVRTIHQHNANDTYPFIWLNPSLAWTGGFRYWESKFHNLANTLMAQRSLSYRAALQRLAQHIAVLELIPYHSKKFGAHRLISTLPSAQLMQDYVHDVLISRAHRGEALIIVTRLVKYWSLEEHENIILYQGGETHRAHLTVNSRGGKAIAQHLGLEV